MKNHNATYNHKLIETALQEETDPLFTDWVKDVIIPTKLSQLEIDVTLEGLEKANSSEINAGNDNDKYITSKALYDSQYNINNLLALSISL